MVKKNQVGRQISVSDCCLYVVATPIGNLGDITYRAIEILQNVAIILAEDTRITYKILNHYQIKNKKLRTYNAYKEGTFDIEAFVDQVFSLARSVALLTDSGTPTISDPGSKIIAACRLREIEVQSLPGASALINALVLSGFGCKSFYFYGFLPNKKGKRKNILQKLLRTEKKVLLFYESPYRVLNFLQNVVEIEPTLDLFVAREMTKKFEEQLRGTAEECYHYFSNKQAIKGEFVIVVDNDSL